MWEINNVIDNYAEFYNALEFIMADDASNSNESVASNDDDDSEYSNGSDEEDKDANDLAETRKNIMSDKGEQIEMITTTAFKKYVTRVLLIDYCGNTPLLVTMLVERRLNILCMIKKSAATMKTMLVSCFKMIDPVSSWFKMVELEWT